MVKRTRFALKITSLLLIFAYALVSQGIALASPSPSRACTSQEGCPHHQTVQMQCGMKKVSNCHQVKVDIPADVIQFKTSCRCEKEAKDAVLTDRLKANVTQLKFISSIEISEYLNFELIRRPQFTPEVPERPPTS